MAEGADPGAAAENRKDCALALVVLLLPLLVAGPLHLAGVPAEGPVAYGTFAFYAVASVLVTRRRGRSLADIGLRREGFLGSLAGSCLLVLGILLLGVLDGDLAWRPARPPLHVAERALYCFGFSGPGQEILFRGLLLFSFWRWKGPAAGLAASSLLYGLAHVRMGPEGMAATALVGGYYALVVLLTRNVWGAAVAHAAHNLLFGYILFSPAALL